MLFCDAFESGDLSQTEGAVRWGSRVTLTVPDERPRSGSQSARIRFARNPCRAHDAGVRGAAVRSDRDRFARMRAGAPKTLAIVAAFAWLLLQLVLPGCVVRVPLEGRPCPCDEERGWFCDPRSSTCLPDGAGFCGVPGASRSAVSLETVEVTWRTDTAMQLSWTVPEEQQPRIDHYELIVATTEEDVLSGGGSAVRFDATSIEHPELRRRGLPDTLGGDFVDGVVLRDLAPDTRYFLQLLVFDVEGRVQCTGTVRALTYRAARDEQVLYDEAPFSAALPECTEHVTGEPELASVGTAFARYDVLCVPDGCDGAPIAVCFENVRLRGLGAPSVDIDPGPFRDIAHMRIDVALDRTDTAYWSEISLSTSAPSLMDDPQALPGPFYLWVAQPQTFVADGAYRTYTSPLAHMVLRCYDDQLALDRSRFEADPGYERQCGRRLLSPEDLTRGIAEVRIGALFDNAGAVRLDHAVLRY